MNHSLRVKVGVERFADISHRWVGLSLIIAFLVARFVSLNSFTQMLMPCDGPACRSRDLTRGCIVETAVDAA